MIKIAHAQVEILDKTQARPVGGDKLMKVAILCAIAFVVGSIVAGMVG